MLPASYRASFFTISWVFIAAIEETEWSTRKTKGDEAYHEMYTLENEILMISGLF